MLKYIEGDLFDANMVNGNHIITHVTNNQNVWGAGFVIPLGNRYPKAKEKYLKYKQTLGRVQFVEVTNTLVVANMCAQTLENVSRPLYYNHLVNCMELVEEHAHIHKATVHAPLSGAGLANGNFEFIQDLMLDIWTDIDVNIYWLPQMLPTNMVVSDFCQGGKFYKPKR